MLLVPWDGFAWDLLPEVVFFCVLDQEKATYAVLRH